MAPKTELHLVNSQVDLQVDSQVDAKSVLINKIKEQMKELDMKELDIKELDIKELEELHSFIKILESKKLKHL
jgi:hypothetical protein